MNKKSRNSNVNFLMKELNIELEDAEELDKFIRVWISRMHANDEIELEKLYDIIDGKIYDYQTSRNRRKRRSDNAKCYCRLLITKFRR